MRIVSAGLLGLALLSGPASDALAQAPAQNTAAPTPDNQVLLTIFLRHDESRPLAELDQQLTRQGFFKAFPPAGVEIVSWTVAMGIGQVIVVRLPAPRVREINRIFEDTAWGPFKTEFYLSYDYKDAAMALHEKAR